MATPIFMINTNWGIKFVQATSLPLALKATHELIRIQLLSLEYESGRPRTAREIKADLAEVDIYDTKMYRNAQYASVTETKPIRTRRRKASAEKPAPKKKMSAATRHKISVSRRRFEKNKKLLRQANKLMHEVPEPIHDTGM